MPAIFSRSWMGGRLFMRPDTKFAVLVVPSLPLPESQTVILSIFRFWIASTCSLTRVSSLSLINRRMASLASPPAADTTCPKPWACLVRISWIDRKSVV